AGLARRPTGRAAAVAGRRGARVGRGRARSRPRQRGACGARASDRGASSGRRSRGPRSRCSACCRVGAVAGRACGRRTARETVIPPREAIALAAPGARHLRRRFEVALDQRIHDAAVADWWPVEFTVESFYLPLVPEIVAEYRQAGWTISSAGRYGRTVLV